MQDRDDTDRRLGLGRALSASTRPAQAAEREQAVVVMAAILAVVFIDASVLLWKRFVRTGAADPRTRRVLGMFGVSSALLSLVLIVLFVANVTVAVQPAEALVNFFNGSF
jgi:RsiW-degrading membrane proteinase PrsW (M82 family)